MYSLGSTRFFLLAKLHDMYLYKTTTFPHQPLRSVSKVAVLQGFYCSVNDHLSICSLQVYAPRTYSQNGLEVVMGDFNTH